MSNFMWKGTALLKEKNFFSDWQADGRATGGKTQGNKSGQFML